MDRYVCVHGHFYQPPRENPWLETVEQQDSAYPFHDWNERITAECYRPNTHARILDGGGRIVRLINNYARMSFNIGPTLLAWMEQAVPDVYADIVSADAHSAERFGGHGSALAQVYNHAIMPLANRRDRRTQIRWGIRDFQHRFGRDPEGMWLAETAVDLDTLDLLAEHEIAFTILSPYQASRTRPVGADRWTDATHGRVDTTRPYVVSLPSGRSIAVFFYDGPISRAVAFEGLLESGESFAGRLLEGFHDQRDGPQLVNIATDGESYGHHHRHGEMALAAALQTLIEREDVTVTNYGQYLELHPPTHEAEIVEDSSWSCAHGVDRWRTDCGCATGGHRDWHQAWREPLREALDWLRDELAPHFLEQGRALLKDPWAARDDYIDVILDRSETSLAAFLGRHARRPLGPDHTVEVLHLLEIQRQTLLMYTSCGWFFDELSRIEPLQVLRYAARAIQLAEFRFQADFTSEFLTRLEKAPSNVAEYGNGRRIYEQLVSPAVTQLEHVAAHFAISGLFSPFGEQERVGPYLIDRSDYHVEEAGRSRLAAGRATIRSTITCSEREVEFGVLHFGDHNFACGVRIAGSEHAYVAMREELVRHFAQADFPELIRALDDHFGDHGYSLRSLFRDEQRRILRLILEATVDEAAATYRNIYRGRAPLMRFLAELGASVPRPLRAAAEVVVNEELRDLFRHGNVDPAHVAALVEEANRFDVALDTDGLNHELSVTLDRVARRIDGLAEKPDVFEAFGPEETAFFTRIRGLVAVATSPPFDVDLARSQNVIYRVLRDVYPELAARAEDHDAAARRWVTHIAEIAELLNVVVPEDT